MKPRCEISVIIPTRNRAFSLNACLEKLCAQSLPVDEFEVVVVLDGQDDEGGAAAGAFAARLNIRVIEAERLGIAHAKNMAIEAARGGLLVLINDDVLPEADFLEVHLRAHAGWTGSAMVVGHSPFVPPPKDEDTVFDLLVRETSLIFFYDRMIDASGRVLMPADHDWGARHAWNMNLSVAREVVMAAGGFRPAIANCCYEDIELAWRIGREFGAPVLFRPRARAMHEHRYTLAACLERERRLGYSALGFAQAAPECASEVLGRDVRSAEEAEYARAFVEREGRSESALLAACGRTAGLPASAVKGRYSGVFVGAALGQMLMLRRLAFRRGLLDVHAGRRLGDLFHAEDGLRVEAGWGGGPGVRVDRVRC